MPVKFEENGFSYDGFGGGYESWTETIITSDITGKELDEEDALYIEDVGYCTKEEVKGEETSLKEIYDERGTKPFKLLGVGVIFLSENEGEEIEIYKKSWANEGRHNKETVWEKCDKNITNVYKLEDGSLTIDKPLFTKVDLEKYFKPVLDGIVASKTLTLNDNETICCFSKFENEKDKIIVESSFDDEVRNPEDLKDFKIYQNEDEYYDAENDDIDDWLDDQNTLESQLETEKDEYEHPENYRDYDDYE